jgi:hypothetical protein
MLVQRRPQDLISNNEPLHAHIHQVGVRHLEVVKWFNFYYCRRNFVDFNFSVKFKRSLVEWVSRENYFLVTGNKLFPGHWK